MKCRRFDSEEALAASLGRLVIDTIRRLPDAVLGLPTGRTPLALYQELIRLSHAEDVDWSGVRTFNLDEFVGLDGREPGSYRAFMEDRLFRHVDIRSSHVGFLYGRASDPDAECERRTRLCAAFRGRALEAR